MRTRLIAKTDIIVSTTFEGLHYWPDAPSVVSFLRTPHRHKFFVQVWIPVTDSDRELEFFMVKDLLDSFIMQADWGQRSFADPTAASCEMMAEQIAGFIYKTYERDGIQVVVKEDDENGAVVKLVLTVTEVEEESEDIV